LYLLPLVLIVSSNVFDHICRQIHDDSLYCVKSGHVTFFVPRTILHVGNQYTKFYARLAIEDSRTIKVITIAAVG